jgi:hypothetical protein
MFSWAPGTGPWMPGGTYVGTMSSTRVSRDDALSVPAVVRGRNLICSIAGLPLVQLDRDNNVAPAPFLAQIDTDVANVVTLAMTIDDLIFEGVSWWRVTNYGWDGFPVVAHHVDVVAVSTSPPPGYPIHTLPSGVFPQGAVWVNGSPVDARDMIRFDSPNPPFLTVGARAVRRALKLAAAAEMYCDDPEARAYWTPEEGADPGTEEEIRAYLAAYAAARRGGAEAYIPAALKRNIAAGMNPVDLQLAQLQQRSDLEIANHLGIDPEDLGVNTTSRTYANAVDRRIDKINETLGMYMRAITDRLSMNDVTKRGQRTRFDLAEYLQADPATRWGTVYSSAITNQIMTVPEIRARESLPAIPVSEPVRPARPTPAMPAPIVPEAPVQQQQQTRIAMGPQVQLAGEHPQGVVVRFTAEDFRADRERRTVAGTVIPFNVPTSDSRRLTFTAGSIGWNRAAVSMIKLDREHDLAQLLGAATEIKSDDNSLRAKFKIARTAGGDEALALAEDGVLDGLSAVVDILAAEPGADGALTVTSAVLRRVTMTADPAFSGARIDTVAASAVRTLEGSTTMLCTLCGREHAAGTPCAPAPTTTTTAPAGTEALTRALTEATTAFTAAVASLNGTVPPEQRATARPAAVVREPLVYRLDGTGPSFVRDAWDVQKARFGSKGADDALARLRKYGEQTEQLAARAVDDRVSLANAGITADQAEIIAPGYRPDLYVGQVPQGRPLFGAIGTRITLRDATSFKVPVWVGSSGLSGTNSEATGPSTGTITDHTYRTVSPTAQSGEFAVSRELMDSSNPAIDVIAMNAMREEYSQDTEAVIATALAAATDNDAGSGISTEGAYVYVVTGTGSDLAIDGIREMEADFGGHRHIAPDRLLASPTGFKALAKAVDDVGRPLFPAIGASNALGTVGRAAQSLDIDGMACPNAWSMTSTYNDIVLFNSVDMLVGESPLLTFRFEEKGGPENIILNIWGYFCYQILRYTGIHACNYTAV